ncbi:MAG: ComEC/Rec2 family competence protein [Candidatus Binatia bacterium]
MTGDRLVFLDVGHGNAAVLHAQGHVCVIDAGPGTTLLEYIRTNKVTSIDLALLSHADKDHIARLLGLLTAGGIPVKRVLLNTDSEKASPTWADLVYELDLHWRNKGLIFEVALTVQQSPITVGTTTLEILAPTPALAAMGPGSKTRDGRRITSNTISAVIRILYEGEPISLLTGDLDAVGLEEMIGRGTVVTAPLVVFPHHGGASGIRSADFATRLMTAATPASVVFSVGRGRYGNPQRDVVDAVRKAIPGTRILCTQLTEQCAAKLPRDKPTHLTSLVAHGREGNRCCGGTLVLRFGRGGGLFPRQAVHLEFIKAKAPTAMCQ